MAKLTLTLEFDDSSLKKRFPLSKSTVSRLAKFVVSQLEGEEVVQETKELIGGLKALSVFVCDDEKIRDFQRQYKSLDRATDVLSFCTRDDMNNSGEGYLGDIVVSVDTVERNAKRYKKSKREEFLRVLIHAMLHLLGYEHVGVSQKRRDQMRQIEAFLLKDLRHL